MEGVGLIVKQAMGQMNLSMSLIKQSAEAQQGLIDVIAETAAAAPQGSGRGSQLDISV